MINTNSDGNITSIVLENTEFKFDGKGPRLFGLDGYNVTASLNVDECEDCVIYNISIKNNDEKTIIPKRIGVYIGTDCYMESYPEWNDKLFPTLMRCEKTHFYGYLMTPDEKILGISCAEAIASYKLLYNEYGHRIYSVELDILNSGKQPSHHCNKLNKLLPGECIERSIRIFYAKDLSEYKVKLERYINTSLPDMNKYSVEKNECICTKNRDEEITVISPTGKRLKNGCKATEYGWYTIFSEKEGKITEGKVYCRRPWSFYLTNARSQAIYASQKATTHCESWYGLFSGYLAAKHFPNKEEDEKIDDKFNEIMPYMFDFEKGEPLLIPERIQNTAVAISLLVDRYEADREKNKYSIDIADRLSDFLISRQKEDGAYYRDGKTHYTCVIYIAKSMLELYLAERELSGYQKKAEKHYNSAKKAIDNLRLLKDNIGTEGEMTFEDGMISCSALQLAMFALMQTDKERKDYVDAAEFMIKKHRCLEQNFIPDCRMRSCSLRYWEAQYDVLIKANMMNSPHAWTAWTLYAKYYLYLATGKELYLKELMDGMGACVQLMEEDGTLNWGFVCDPFIEAPCYVPDKKLNEGSSGKKEVRVLSEEYIPMISGWFKQNKQCPTGGFLECPLIMRDKTEKVDTQGGCCDNDVHEIFKCMEETVLKKAFLHECDDGSFLCYSCRIKNEYVELEDEAEVLCYNVKKNLTVSINGNNVLLTSDGVNLYKI